MAKSDVKQKQKANFSAASFKITEYSHFCYKLHLLNTLSQPRVMFTCRVAESTAARGDPRRVRRPRVPRVCHSHPQTRSCPSQTCSCEQSVNE